MSSIIVGVSFSHTLEETVERTFVWRPRWLKKEQRWMVMEHGYRINGLRTGYKDKYISEADYNIRRLVGKHAELWVE